MTRQAIAVRHILFEDLGIFTPLLEERGYTIAYREAGIDDFAAESLVDADLVVVLGGPIGVYETESYPFLLDEKRALLSRLEAGRPTLGICLGAQLIAEVLGASVTATGRKEIGYAPLTLTPAGRQSVLANLDGVAVLHWHGDQFGIPQGAERLAKTPGFPNQAFSLGPNVLGLQFHLEADPRRLEAWLIGHANELAGADIDPRDLRRDARTYGTQLSAAAITVLNTWLDGLEEQA